MAQNAISSLEPSSFAGLQSIRIVNLSGNSIAVLDNNLFPDFTKTHLLILDLSQNDISAIRPSTFAELRYLQQLDLSRNSLKDLNETAFTGLRALRKLYLQTNDIHNIQQRTFSNLPNVDHIDISFNSLSSFSGDVFGMELPRLRKLFLKSNSLLVLQPRSFDFVPALDYLSISFNDLTTLDAELFRPIPNLRKLHIGHNHIELLEAKLFNYTPRISDLIINHNRLTFFPDVDIDFNQLKRVSLEGNPWQCPCLEDVLGWLDRRNIDYRSKGNPYFEGRRPLCVVTPVNVCIKNIDLVREHHVVALYDDAVLPTITTSGRDQIDKYDEV